MNITIKFPQSVNRCLQYIEQPQITVEKIEYKDYFLQYPELFDANGDGDDGEI